jgi:hypothetical protein
MNQSGLSLLIRTLPCVFDVRNYRTVGVWKHKRSFCFNEGCNLRVGSSPGKNKPFDSAIVIYDLPTFDSLVASNA